MTVAAWHRRSPSLALLVLCATPIHAAPQESTAASEPPAPLVLSAAIELPQVEGRIDHLAVDLGRERLFVAALGNDSVEVVDLAAQAHLRSLRGVGEPQGILFLADLDRMVVTSGKAGTCEVYDGETLEKVASVEVGGGADNLRYDPRTKRVYVACEGALGIVDAEAWKLEGSIELAGHPESFQLDRLGKRAFVNVPDVRAVVLVDLEARKKIVTWRLDEAQSNFPMAIAPSPRAGAVDDRILVGCRAPPKLLVRSCADGKPLQAVDLSGDTDDVFVDVQRKRVYAACGEGFVEVFAHEESGLRALTRVPTAPGARTCLFVPERSQLFVAVPHRVAQRAEVRVFDAEAGQERATLALDFDHERTGTLPAGWRTGATKHAAPLASWSIVADAGAPTPPNALALTASTHGSSGTFNLCWSEALRFQDGVIELSFKADKGEEDQGGGPIWRVQGENDYYVCRMNPLESNFRVYCVKGGVRRQLASAKVEAATGTWHRIRIEHDGQRIRCALDGAVLLEVTDDQLPAAGGVGFWTKADALTSFDDLRVIPR